MRFVIQTDASAIDPTKQAPVAEVPDNGDIVHYSDFEVVKEAIHASELESARQNGRSEQLNRVLDLFNAADEKELFNIAVAYREGFADAEAEDTDEHYLNQGQNEVYLEGALGGFAPEPEEDVAPDYGSVEINGGITVVSRDESRMFDVFSGEVEGIPTPVVVMFKDQYDGLMAEVFHLGVDFGRTEAADQAA